MISQGKEDEEVNLWLAYAHFHLGEYKRAIKV